MMTFAFDLISDLHIETWPDFDWTGQATAPYCVVAGDVARDLDLVVETLAHLGTCYAGVFYIDGNDEHRYNMLDLDKSYSDLKSATDTIPNLVFLQENVVIINGVAFLGTNGWWHYDFDLASDSEQSQAWYAKYIDIPMQSAGEVVGWAYRDATYMRNSIRKLQTHQEVKHIVVVTHTVPTSRLVDHDIELVDTHRFGCLGNQHMQLALDEDSENKIKTWCFGHYHRMVDREFDGVRYVNNCRGRGDTPWCQPAYYPRRIEINV